MIMPKHRHLVSKAFQIAFIASFLTALACSSTFDDMIAANTAGVAPSVGYYTLKTELGTTHCAEAKKRALSLPPLSEQGTARVFLSQYLQFCRYDEVTRAGHAYARSPIDVPPDHALARAWAALVQGEPPGDERSRVIHDFAHSFEDFQQYFANYLALTKSDGWAPSIYYAPLFPDFMATRIAQMTEHRESATTVFCGAVYDDFSVRLFQERSNPLPEKPISAYSNLTRSSALYLPTFLNVDCGAKTIGLVNLLLRSDHGPLKTTRALASSAGHFQRLIEDSRFRISCSQFAEVIHGMTPTHDTKLWIMRAIARPDRRTCRNAVLAAFARWPWSDTTF